MCSLLSCDLLLAETGHHHPPELAEELIQRNLVPGRLAFIHHGRDILDRYDEQAAALRALLGKGFTILEDAATIIV